MGWHPSPVMGKKIIRVIEASIVPIISRLGHPKISEIRYYKDRAGQQFEYAATFSCGVCYQFRPNGMLYVWDGVSFHLEKPYGDEYFHLYAMHQSKTGLGRNEIAILDKNGDDAMFKRDIPKILFCTKYQNFE